MNKLIEISSKDVRHVIGLMSGTSVDGIDIAIVKICGEYPKIRTELLSFNNIPYEESIREKIFELFDPKQSTVEKIGYMNFLLGEVYSKAILESIKSAGLTIHDVDVIGSHGQTIYHAPKIDTGDGYPVSYTVQIGEGAVIANRTGIPCVSDFRVADMAVGGQGAPLVPYTEYLLYKSDVKNILLQNIGGIGNITVIPAGCSSAKVSAFDTGPGNMIIDGLVEKITLGKMRMDIGGNIAKKGIINNKLLDYLKESEYYLIPPPKSTGREYFGKEYVEAVYLFMKENGISDEDGVKTVTYLTAWSIADSYNRFIKKECKADELIIGGGGSYNPVLVDYIRQEMSLHGVQTFTQEELGLSSDAKEAIAFAILADAAIKGEPNNLPSVTGAKSPVVMGKISI